MARSPAAGRGYGLVNPEKVQNGKSGKMDTELKYYRYYAPI
jgi:hypothetical protein